MYSNHKLFHSIIVILLLIQLVIGTPFNISVADDVLQSSEVIQSIAPVENTVLSEPTTTSFPVSEVTVTTDATVITYTENTNTDNTTADTTTSSTDTSTNNITDSTIITDTTLPTENTNTDNTTADTTTSSTDVSTNDITDTNQNIVDPSLFDANTSITNGGATTSETHDVAPDLDQQSQSLITFKPQKNIAIYSGLIDPLSIDSYNVIDENSTMTFCSYVSYLNLSYITNINDDITFARGDALQIWTNLTLQSTIAATGEVVFTGTNISGTQFIEYISGVYATSGSSLFDIVTFKPKTQDDQTEGLSLRQSHRFVIFFGSDLERYVLDPIRIHSSDPILLKTYLEEHIFAHEDVKIIASYTLADTIPEERENPLTTGHTDNTIVVHSPMEFLPYVLQGLISAPNTGDTITNEVVFHTGFRYETLNGDVSAYLPAGLIIKTADGEEFNPFTFNIQELSGNNSELASGYDDKFKFGIDGQHLVFSQPIGLTIQTPTYEENVLLDLMVQHEGQDWNKQGLTKNSTKTCLSDGSVSEDDQLHTVQVQSGQVKFYTCGASSFAFGYVPGLASPNGDVTTIREQPDGKIIIGGAFTTVGGVARNRIARLHTDKSLDMSFNPGPNGNVTDIKLQPDGKILVAGAFSTIGGVTRNRIARLHQDGSVDKTFNPNANSTVSDIEIQSDGKILLGGAFATVGGVTRNYAARVTSTGALDTTFNATISVTAAVNDIEIQSDGKILLGGTFTTVGGVTRNYAARVSSTGGLDTTFNPNLNNLVNDIEIQSDGKILLGGTFTTVGGVTRNYAARVSSTGGLDTSFNATISATAIVNTIEAQSDGKILLGGTFVTVGGVTRNRIARVSSTGAIDTTFNPNANSNISKIMILNSGKIAIGGVFTTLGGVAQACLAFYDDIVMDTVYNVRPNGVVNRVLTLPNGELVIGGVFTGVGDTGRNRIAKLNSNLTLDKIFNPNINNTVNEIEVDSNGNFIVAGNFTVVGATTRNRIARITSTGALDTSFDPNVNNSIFALTIQPDGKILIGGAFTGVGGTTRNSLARINTDGTLDTSFDPNANGTVTSIAIEPDGDIVIGGFFTTVGGIGRSMIARVTSTGALDTTFNSSSDATIYDIIVQPDGKILLGGAFSTIGGTARNRVARISSTGAIDTTFNPNSNSNINDMYLLGNGDVILGGAFSTMGGVARLQLAKVSSTGLLDTNFNIAFSASTTINNINMDREGNLVVGGTFTTMSGNANNAYMGRVGLNSAMNNLSLWMRADTGTNCTTNGCAISQWNDNSNYSNHAIQSTGAAQPIYKTNVLNGNPVINFNTTAKYLANTMTGSYRTVFAVRNLASTGYQYLFSAPALGDFSIRTAAAFNGTSNLDYTDGPNVGDWSNGGSLAIDGKVTNVGKTRYHIVRDVSSTVITNTYSISNTFSSRGMYGNDGVAELIVYNTGVDTITTNQIESYLSIKYGITLDQSTIGGQNYTLSNNAISWSTGSAGVYTSDIAGIARDNAMNLLQIRSQSINNTGDIIISGNTTLTNLTSLIWANNGGTTGVFSTTEIPSGIGERISRERHIQEKNGDVGNITVTYPITTGLLATGELALMIDTDGDFTNGGTSVVTGSISGGYRKFTTNLADNSYISFGIVDNGDVCIEGPDNFNLGSYTTKNSSQNIDVLSNYFKVDDQKGSTSGYYSTLSVSNLTGLSGNTISSATAIQIQATSIDTLSGTANPSVILDNSITSYISANTPVTFIKRNSGTGVGIKGLYGSKINFRIILPAYQKADVYSGTITYTLYEN